MHGSRQLITKFVPELLLGLLQNSSLVSEIILCPPAIYISEVAALIRRFVDDSSLKKVSVELGAQNVYDKAEGAYTGEIASGMLLDMGCRYVIIGHSERRQLFYEDDTLIARKFKAAYHTGLIPILCVGETGTERALGKTWERIRSQLEAVFNEEMPLLAQTVIAYEPVWAIGTGLTAAPEEAQAMHQAIRDWIRAQHPAVAEEVRILYGGSVKASNARGFFEQPNIDGALVGGASLMADEFLSICNSANIVFSNK